ncbi:hypothetical protein L6164_007761 [Bauhinia variegata]|uniref:Uncharacterized protein n=1 Tax=Bauhinia variegata TaxID=167791 RepID=A0ACB9PEW3_BAUVA|nr:hypothetical protein L6164_007761 [Bauhinia variegata]
MPLRNCKVTALWADFLNAFDLRKNSSERHILIFACSARVDLVWHRFFFLVVKIRIPPFLKRIVTLPCLSTHSPSVITFLFHSLNSSSAFCHRRRFLDRKVQPVLRLHLFRNSLDYFLNSLMVHTGAGSHQCATVILPSLNRQKVNCMLHLVNHSQLKASCWRVDHLNS